VRRLYVLILLAWSLVGVSACGTAGSNATKAPSTATLQTPAPKGAPCCMRANMLAGKPAALAPVQWQHNWARGAVIYQLFVRSFFDSDGDGNGDFKGATAKLDYLNDGDPQTITDLGVEGIWVMPFHPSPSYHGYDVTNYEAINPQYGTMADFQQFVSEAHKRGIRVIMDFVINHTSAQHPWFIDSATGPKARFRSWYVWSPTPLDWVQPWEGGKDPVWHARNGAYYYAAFWGEMPDLNHLNPEVRARMKELAKFWLTRGVDGLRVDGSRYLIETGSNKVNGGQRDTPETHAYWREFSAFVRSIKPETVIVGENWVPLKRSDTAILASYYGSTKLIKGGDELSMNFNFPLSGRIIGALKDGKAEPILDKLKDMLDLYPAGVVDAPFLTNHDMSRIGSEFAGHRGRLGVAAALLLTMPGSPYVYYGEELGLQDGVTDHEDRHKRTPMPWSGGPTGGFTTGTPWYGFAPQHSRLNVASETRDRRSLLNWYKSLIAARHASRALREGALALTTPQPDRPTVVAYLRQLDGERVLVVHNVGSQPVKAFAPGVEAQQLVEVLDSGSVRPPKRTASGWKLDLPPLSSAAWRLL